MSFIEQHSIDYVPIAERHGKVWHLWPVWFSGDAHLATIATGVVGIALGGDFAWMALAVILGCAFGTVSRSRIVQKFHRHSSRCGPMVVAEHSAEALAALNRMMG